MHASIPKAAQRLLQFIKETETGRKDNTAYDTVYAHKEAQLPKKLTSMTLGQVIAAGPSWTKKFGSSAAGAYQFMNRTLKDLDTELDWLTTKTVFSIDTQDRLGYALLLRRGYKLFMSGKISRAEFGKRLAQEWASLPVLAATTGAHKKLKRGQSYYAGDALNKALVKPEAVEKVLKEIKGLPAESSVPVETITVEKPVDVPVVVEKPIVADPGELSTPPSQSKTVWTWLLTAIGTPLAAFANFDWRVQILIVIVIVGFAIYGIKRRFDLAKGVRELEQQFLTDKLEAQAYVDRST